MNSIGIMQGRLSPPERGKLQFFPSDWMAEFPRAKELGFGHIQWFFDREKPAFDPIKDIWTHTEVVAEIDRVRSIVPISSIDAGKYLWFGPEANATIASFQSLFPLVEGRLSTGVVSIPLLKHLAPKTEEEKKEVIVNLTAIATAALPLGIRLALETEMPAPELLAFIDSFALPNVGVTYDVGNSTSFGFDCPREIRELSQKIFEVHLKDCRLPSAPSVLLGEGDVNFPSCFQAFAEIGYRGAYTLQAWRDEDYLESARKQLQFVKQFVYE